MAAQTMNKALGAEFKLGWKKLEPGAAWFPPACASFRRKGCR